MRKSEMGSVQCVYVISDVDGFQYKLVMDGNVELLTVGKVKRYMHKATGLSPQHQELTFNGRVMQEGECGKDVGLTDRAVMQLRHVNAAHKVSPSDNYSNIKTANTLPIRSISSSTIGFQKEPAVVKTVSSTDPPVSTSIPGLSLLRTPSSHEREERKIRGDLMGSVNVDAHNHGKSTESVCRRLELENAQLMERLLETERLLANSRSDWHLQEEVTQLRATVGHLRQEQQEAERKAAERWREKEEELVRELDRLREERRRMGREKAFFEEEQRALVRGLEAQLRAQRKELVEQETLLHEKQLEVDQLRLKKCLVSEKVERNLTQLTQELNIDSLKLDDNDTCVVSLDDGANMLITLDTATERVFMYATIANTLPSCPDQRLQLYELLLEGALLGREMAGGGVGVCTQNNLIIMDICVDVAHADDYALASVARPFMTSVRHWVNVVRNLFPQE